jgi:hypothetical protein
MHHTPAPWLYDHRDNQALIVDTQGFTVVELSTLENSTAHSALADNARLIAAAPDLLAALKAMHACHRAFSNAENWTALDDDARAAAESAINKATGE